MFVIGKSNDEEIKEMEAMGFDVEYMDVACFNAGMNTNGNHDPKHPDNQPDECIGDKLAVVFLDCDIVQEMRTIHAAEKNADYICKKKEILRWLESKIGWYSPNKRVVNARCIPDEYHDAIGTMEAENLVVVLDLPSGRKEIGITDRGRKLLKTWRKNA